MYRRSIAISLVLTLILFGMFAIPGFSSTNGSFVEATDTLGRRILLYEDFTWRYAQSDMSNLYWGMSMEQVGMVEKMRFSKIDDSTLMAMNAQAFDMNGMLILGFEHNRLMGAIYLFDEHHADGDRYIEDYHNLVDHFISSYGEPTEEIVEWVGEETNAIGEAFLDGLVEMATRWETERSNIMCGLANDDEIFGLLVACSDIESEEFSF